MNVGTLSTIRCPDCGHRLILDTSAYYKNRRQRCPNRKCAVIQCIVSHHTREKPQIIKIIRKAVPRTKPLNNLTMEFIIRHPEVLNDG